MYRFEITSGLAPPGFPGGPDTHRARELAERRGYRPDERGLPRRVLIINERLEEYDGTTAVVRSEHLEAEEIEFLRWRAERWMKARHMAAVLRHSPGFVLRNWRTMLAHTVRGGSFWASLLGLADER
jgi:hypothetical protein